MSRLQCLLAWIIHPDQMWLTDFNLLRLCMKPTLHSAYWFNTIAVRSQNHNPVVISSSDKDVGALVQSVVYRATRRVLESVHWRDGAIFYSVDSTDTDTDTFLNIMQQTCTKIIQ